MPKSSALLARARPENRAAIEKGERHHAGKAAFEEASPSAISVGWWLLVAGVS